MLKEKSDRKHLHKCLVSARILMTLVLSLFLIIPVASIRADAQTTDPFLIYVQDVLYITDRGTAIVGRVVQGTCRSGDELTLMGHDTDGKPVSYHMSALSLEMFHKQLDKVEEGDNCSILISSSDLRGMINIGDALADPSGGFFNSKAGVSGYFTASTERTSNVSGGEYQAYGSGANSDTTVQLTLEKVNVRPGAKSRACISDLAQARVYYPGQTIELKRGGVLYGTFKVYGFNTEEARMLWNSSFYGVINNSDSPWRAVTDKLVAAGWSMNKGSSSDLIVRISCESAGLLSFDYFLTQDSNSKLKDEFSFEVDGEKKFSVNIADQTWKTYGAYLTAGEHVLKWSRVNVEGSGLFDNSFYLKNLAWYKGRSGLPLDPNHGSIDGKYGPYYIVNTGEHISLPIPVRPGYRFLGWFRENESVRISYGGYHNFVCRNSDDYINGFHAEWVPEDWTAFQGWYFEEDSFSNTGWTRIDGDGDGFGWGLNLETTPNTFFDAYEGIRCLYSESEHDSKFLESTAYTPGPDDGPLNPDNWVISPAVTLPDSECYLSVMAKGANQEFALYAGTSPDPSKMKKIGANRVGSGSWTEYHADLKAYAGKKVYVAIRHMNSSYKSILYVDRVEIRRAILTVTMFGVDTISEEGVIFDTIAGFETRRTIVPSDIEWTEFFEGAAATAYANGMVYVFRENGNMYYGSIRDIDHLTNKKNAYVGWVLSATYDYSRDSVFLLMKCDESDSRLQLCRYFPSTSKVSSLGYLPGSENSLVTCITAGENGTLYGMTKDHTLVTIDPKTMKTQKVFKMTEDLADVSNDLCYDYTNDLIYYSQYYHVGSWGYYSIFALDPKSGSVVGRFNLSDIEGPSDYREFKGMFVVPEANFTEPVIVTLGKSVTPGVYKDPKASYQLIPDDPSIFRSEGSKLIGTKTGSTGVALRVDNGSVLKAYARCEFTDVTRTSDKGKAPYFYDAVYWAVDEGITGGVKVDGAYKIFNPQGDCNRAQMISFLWRMAGCPEPTYSTSIFKDVKKSDYYYKAVLWATEQKIVGGYNDGTFRPGGSCTRAQAVTFMWRYMGSPEPKTNTSSFTDIKDKKAYYYKAVLWAAENGITGGYSDKTFRPDGKCTRCQMVTFLYRLKYSNVIVYDKNKVLLY